MVSRIWGTSAEHSRKRLCGKEEIVWKRRTLPHHTQDTIWHRQKAQTIFDMSFHPLYPSSVSCCAQCRKPLRNKAPTINALDGRLWALFCLDQFYSKECNTPQALHQKLTSIAYWNICPCFRKFQHDFRCIDDGVGADRGGHVYTTLRGTVRWEGCVEPGL